MYPISQNKNIVEFCYRLDATDPLQIVDIACGEIHYHLQANKKLTGLSNFRSGSKGRLYCEQLQMLVTIFVNGQVPSSSSIEFRHDIEPLVRRVLKAGWHVGNLEKEFKIDK